MVAKNLKSFVQFQFLSEGFALLRKTCRWFDHRLLSIFSVEYCIATQIQVGQAPLVTSRTLVLVMLSVQNATAS